VLSRKGKISISELEHSFNLSPASVRRLCARLETEGAALRTRGGLRSIPETQLDYSFEIKAQEYSAAKERIAEYCCNFLRDGQTIFLESGTTVYQCAMALAEHIRSGELKNITVFTNSLNNLRALSGAAPVNIVGGLYRPERQDFAGYLCERFLRNLNFDHVIIGIDAIDPQDGVMALDFDTARVDETLLSQSQNVIVVAHSAKFRKHSLLSFASVQDIDAIVTDAGLSDETYEQYVRAGAEVIRV